MPPYQYRGRATYPSYYGAGEPKTAQYYQPTYRPPTSAYSNPYAYRGPSTFTPPFSPGGSSAAYRPFTPGGATSTYRPFPAPAQRFAPAAAMAAQGGLPWYQVMAQRLRMLEAQIAQWAGPPAAPNPLRNPPWAPGYVPPQAAPQTAAVKPWWTPGRPAYANEPKATQFYQPPPTGPQGYANTPGPSYPTPNYGGYGGGGGYGYGGGGGGGYKAPSYPGAYPQAAETGQPFMQRGGREGQQGARYTQAPELPRWLARLVTWNYG